MDIKDSTKIVRTVTLEPDEVQEALRDYAAKRMSRAEDKRFLIYTSEFKKGVIANGGVTSSLSGVSAQLVYELTENS